MFGRNRELLLVRHYGQPSYKKRERAKDYLCAMVADGLMQAGVKDALSAPQYVRLFARPLMRYRRNFVWAPMFQILYWPVICKMITPEFMKLIFKVLEIKQELKMLTEQVKWLRKMGGPKWYKTIPDGNLSAFGRLVFAASISLKRKPMIKFPKAFGWREGKWLVADAIFDWWRKEILAHPAYLHLVDICHAYADFIARAGEVFEQKVHDTRVSDFGRLNLDAPPLATLEVFGKKPLSAKTLKRLDQNKTLTMLYYIVRICFDREAQLTWNFPFGPHNNIKVEFSEEGVVVFNSLIVDNSGPKPITRRFRPAALKKLGKIWAFLPSDLGFVPTKRHGRYNILNAVNATIVKNDLKEEVALPRFGSNAPTPKTNPAMFKDMGHLMDRFKGMAKLQKEQPKLIQAILDNKKNKPTKVDPNIFGLPKDLKMTAEVRSKNFLWSMPNQLLLELVKKGWINKEDLEP
jgi:hypothetical protein